MKVRERNRRVAINPGAYTAPTAKAPTQKQIEYYDLLLAAMEKNALGEGLLLSKANTAAITSSINIMKDVLRKNNINWSTGEKWKEGDPYFVKAYNLYSYVHVCYCEHCEHYAKEKNNSPRSPGGLGTCRRLQDVGRVEVKMTDFCSYGKPRKEEADG